MEKKDSFYAYRNKSSLKAKLFNGVRAFAALTLLIIFAGASAYAQKTKEPVRMNNVSVEQVLNQIERTSDYSFLFNDDIDTNRMVSVNNPEGNIIAVLDRIFGGTNVKYTVVDKQIILSEGARQQQQSATTVSGVVKDTHGSPLMGVSISVQGTPTGTTSGLDGSYSLASPQHGSTLVFSYMGYSTQTFTYDGRSIFNVTLNEETTQMEEVVVTALGIKRERKVLTYNVQQLVADDFMVDANPNFLNNLSGRLAGVTINSTSSGAGSSTRFQMRGTKSLSGDNNALYVVDGVPMPSLRMDQMEGIYEVPDGGDGDAFSHLNPDDIESVSVLTGSAAAALYGHQGAAGAILITTKKGIEGAVRISYKNSTNFTSPFVMPEFQNTYGAEEGSYSSWGDKLESPSSYNPRDFFQTGYSVSNSVALTTGTETNQTYASLGSYNSRGIIPNNKYNKYNLNINNNAVLLRKGGKDIVNMGLGIMYMKQNDQNQPRQGLYHNPLVPIYLFPASDDITKYQLYETYDVERGFRTQNWQYDLSSLSAQNPYWIVNRSMFNTERDRYILSANLSVKPLSWLTVAGRARYDRTMMGFTRKIYASSLNLFASDYGNYMEGNFDYSSFYGDVLASADFRWDDLTFNANVGASFDDFRYDYEAFEGHLLNVANWFHAKNIDMNNHAYMRQDIYHTQTQSIYATAELGYKGMFLNLTARNDWSSQFAGTITKSFFYPSVGLSAVITDMVKTNSKYLSFAKIRASYSEVGGPPPAYIAKVSHPKEQAGGSQTPETNTVAPATNLKPERTKEVEVGANVYLFNSKLAIDFTYYNQNTINQLFFRPVSPTKNSGYNAEYVNAGKVRNSGIELSVSYKQDIGPVKWTSGLTYTHNRNKIIELLPDEKEVEIMTVGTYKSKLVEGGSTGDIYGNGLATDHEGNVFVDVNLGTISADTDTWYKLGSTDPKYTLGFNNAFSWKGISLSFLITARVGGVGTSATQAIMDQYGASKATADARDRGGVDLNYGTVTPTNWYSVVAGGQTGLLAYYTYSSTNVRLRELSIGYSLPSKWFRDKADVTVSLVGNNLFMFYCKAPYDPELTSSSGTYFQGFDYFRAPSVRSLGFNVNIKF